ncbi:MAG: TetR family transcriptional regulator [Aeromicrobium sp.]|nr:MAG: TetR family transcriptional regulator [Aeromicrobium sp.]
MRQRLLDAAIESLVENGWSGTSTTEVSRRAGVSRGAQLHHFPNKFELVKAAVEHLAELRRSELAVKAQELSEEHRVREALELLSEHFTGPVFQAALELWVAARSDEALRVEMIAFERAIGRELHFATVELLGIDESRGCNRQYVQLTLDLMRGLGLAQSLNDDSERRRILLDTWAKTLERELE